MNDERYDDYDDSYRDYPELYDEDVYHEYIYGDGEDDYEHTEVTECYA